MKRFGLGLMLAGAALCGPVTAVGQSATNAPSLALGQTVNGALAAGDAQRRSGKYEDVFTIQGRRGERIDLRLVSADFDAYLVVSGPNGFGLSNDDGPDQGDALHSRLTMEFPEDGVYRVAATSFRPGETGAYRLAAAAPPAGARIDRPQPAAPIRVGQTIDGRLAPGDGRRAGGELADRYRFSARRGERVRIALSSASLDAHLTLIRPDGSEEVNDDSQVDGQASLDSRLDTVLAEDGDYVIVASSYRQGAAGAYRLSLARSPGLPRQQYVQGGPRVIALLVGVSDYGERASPLPNTDADARELYNGLRAAGLLHPASRLLTNGEATRANVAAAFRRAAAAAGPDDMFVFFFSGHGNQVDVPVSAAELDGRSETIELYDATLTDAQLAPLFRSVNGRLSMLVLDSCFSGGFRSLIDRPNVVGMFSSEEDLTSLVASRFKAGGFLAYFLRTGLAGEADDDGDRIVTAGELSTYVRRRFRREGDIPAQTREDEWNYQNLLVERGGVHIDDVVVRLAGAIPPVTGARRPASSFRPAAAVRRDEPLAQDEGDGGKEEIKGGSARSGQFGKVQH